MNTKLVSDNDGPPSFIRSEGIMGTTFIEEILKEVKEQEQSLEMKHADKILMDISELQNSMDTNMSIVEHEIKIITEWMEQKNLILQRRIDWLSSKLEEYIEYREYFLNAVRNGDCNEYSLFAPNLCMRY